MAILPIYTYNDDVLREEAEPVRENSDELQKLIDDMFETMYHADGVGLAAPQVGKTIRLFVCDTDVMADDDEPTYGPIAFLNPEIGSESDDSVELEEGCLSIPGVNGPVTRPESIEVEYLDRNLKKQKLQASGWTARVIQHEIDHLDGILFVDHLSSFKRKLLYPELKKIERGNKETSYPLASKEKMAN
ncbi:MAG: peptide deformylase [Balneolaceae bacterium]|nr:peptide deformylase [Balneolaceae bacterium]